VGWDIDIVSEEVLKKEIAQQMGRMMASGEAVPITALEGVNNNQAEILAERGVDDVEKLAAMTIDDLVEALDLSLDQAETILAAAREVVAAKEVDAAADGEKPAQDGAEEATPDPDVIETAHTEDLSTENAGADPEEAASESTSETSEESEAGVGAVDAPSDEDAESEKQDEAQS
jgi:hypothetical protein